MKICSKCKVAQPLTEFGKMSRGRDGLHCWCKSCVRVSARRTQQRYKDANSRRDPYAGGGTKRCSRCRTEKTVLEFSRRDRARDGLEPYCKPCASVRFKTWAVQHPDQPRERYHRDIAASRQKQQDYRRRRPDVSARYTKWRWWAAKERADPREPRITRARLYALDGGICQNCGVPCEGEHWHTDHYIPLSKGGKHIWANVRVVCPLCNARKGSKMPDGTWRRQNI